MIYSLSQIESVSECDTILADAGKMKSNYEIRKLGLERQIASSGEMAASLPAQLEAAQVRVADSTAMWEAEQDPKRKRRLEKTVNSDENDVRELSKKLAQYGALGILTREQKLDFTTEYLAELNAYIAGVEARKAELINNTANAA